jgi:hypothetical protein
VSHSTALPRYINPAVRPGLDALSLWLEQNHYSQHARERILAHTAAEGCPFGSPCIELEDEAGASGAFLRALPAVPYDDPAWDDESVILDVAMLAAGTHPFPMPDDDGRDIPPDAAVVPPELDPDDDDDISVEELIPSPAKADPDAEPPDSWRGDGSVGWASLPPISGGSPDAPEFTPSDADWADYRSHFDRAELLYGYE